MLVSRLISKSILVRTIPLTARALSAMSPVVRTLVHHIAGEGNMQLHLIARDQITSFKEWVVTIPTNKPSLVYLEPGLWLKNKLSDDDSSPEWAECPTHDEDKGYAFRKELAEFIETKGCKQPTVFVTAVESVSQDRKSVV